MKHPQVINPDQVSEEVFLDLHSATHIQLLWFTLTMLLCSVSVCLLKRCNSHSHQQPAFVFPVVHFRDLKEVLAEFKQLVSVCFDTGFRGLLNMCSHYKFQQGKDRGARLPVFPSQRTSQCDPSQAAGQHNERGCDSAFTRPVTGDYPNVV